MFSKFEYDGKLNPTFKEGPFQLPVSSIKTFMKEPVTPRFIAFLVVSYYEENLLLAWVLCFEQLICADRNLVNLHYIGLSM